MVGRLFACYTVLRLRFVNISDPKQCTQTIFDLAFMRVQIPCAQIIRKLILLVQAVEAEHIYILHSMSSGISLLSFLLHRLTQIFPLLSEPDSASEAAEIRKTCCMQICFRLFEGRYTVSREFQDGNIQKC